MNKKQLRKKLALMLATLKKKRKYYVECEYLESTGAQYIDTGVLPVNDMEFECKFTFTSLVNTNLTILGSRDGEKRCQPIGAYNNKWSASIGDSYDANGTSVSANTPYIIKSTITNGQTITTNVNGSQASTCTSTTGLPSQELYIFARNFYGNPDPADSKVNGKLNFLKIKANGVLVRDLIPVLDWNMTPCMYDKVTEQLFYNQGTGDFVAGRQVHPVEYLESTGTQYIDTGVKYNSNKTYQIKNKIIYIEALGQSQGSGWDAGGQNSISTNGELVVGASLLTGDITGKIVELSQTINSGTNTLTVYNYSVDGVAIPTASRNHTSLSQHAGNGGYGIGAMYSTNTFSYFTKAKFFNYSISENDTIVRDYLPAIDENGVGFMFDRVSHTCFLNAGQGQFKYPAREVEYLESTGEQYIDTGYNPGANGGRFTFDVEFLSLYSGYGGIVLGSRSSQNSRNWAIVNGAIKQQIGYGNTFSNLDFESSGKLQRQKTYIESDSYIYECSNDSSVEKLSLPIQTFSNTANIYLFGGNNMGSLFSSYKFAGKIKYAKLYDSDNLVRDLIPCYKDGVACMVDKLTGTAYINQGTGSFSVGRIIEPEYE